jgi:hypothetical protein
MKLNNKGFAISTVVYGLSIMGILIVSILMSTMSSTRNNNTTIASSIEEDLNRFSKSSTSFDSSVSGAQQFVVPTGESGWYRIELWGASGGNSGGLGAYTSGVIKLEAGTSLYFYVGKSTSSGGEETDVRILNGDYKSSASYNTRIMVAAGGGTDSGAGGGTLFGYTSKMTSLGGYIDFQGAYDSDYKLFDADEPGNNTNGTLVGFPSNYTESGISMKSSSVGIKGTSGGGDGYIPSNTSSTGGVSYISGYAGVKSTIKGVKTDSTKYTYYEISSYNAETDQVIYEADGTDYYFLDGMMLPGVNSGDGKAKIEKVVAIEEEEYASATLPRKNTKMNNVKYVRDCITGEDNNVEVNVITSGEKQNLTEVASLSDKYCKTYELNTVQNVDEIAVFHSKSGHDYKNHTIEVSTDSTSWRFLKNKSTETEYSETETVTGIRISAYQYDSTESFPLAGNYYLMPVVTENKVVTATDSANKDVNAVTISYLNGFKRQKWSVEQIPEATRNNSDLEYKFTELARYKALTITLDENRLGNEVYTGEEFNKTSRNEPQIWKIIPLGNGTYAITTVVIYFDTNRPTGYLIPQVRSDYSDSYNKVIIGKRNFTTQRFKLVSIDYSSTGSSY